MTELQPPRRSHWQEVALQVFGDSETAPEEILKRFQNEGSLYFELAKAVVANGIVVTVGNASVATGPLSFALLQKAQEKTFHVHDSTASALAGEWQTQDAIAGNHDNLNNLVSQHALTVKQEIGR